MDSTFRRFNRCQCYYTRNYYVEDYNVHLEYFENDGQFLRDNSAILQLKGCNTEEKRSKVLKHIKSEFKRRKALDSEFSKRREKIRADYVPLHKEVYVIKEEYLKQKFLDIIQYAKTSDATAESLQRMLKLEKPSKVYRFPVFTQAFCRMFLEEIDNFERSEMPKGRPNTMNNGGALLGEIGFDEHFITPLREKYLSPLAKLLYPEWHGVALDSHKAFTVNYKEGEDVDLGFHFDNAEVTLNVSLGKIFEDGTLYFGSMRQEPTRMDKTTEAKHTIGDGILHRGQHRHGAMPISFGERVNLIIWMRSSTVRNKLCPMCDCEPILTPATGFGDGFTKTPDVEICNLN